LSRREGKRRRMKEEKKNLRKEGDKKNCSHYIIFIVSLIVFSIFMSQLVFADPDGVTGNVLSNETKASTSAFEINISGGYISTINITAVTQNLKWKAFVGDFTGKFTLDDASGSTIYDWTLATVSGEIFATRNSSSLTWSSIDCANVTHIETENVNLNHTNSQDNITATFSSSTHPGFFVGSVEIAQDSCGYVLNTYVNDAAQTSDFYEVALYTGSSMVYTTILEQNQTGFDGEGYDFQMIAPEVGYPGFSGSTAYYLYAELT